MFIECVNDLKEANASDIGIEVAAHVQVKLQKAKEVIEQMNVELSSSIMERT